MKIPLIINLGAFTVWIMIFIWQPIYGLMGLLPFGILQVALSSVLIFTGANSKIRNLASLHVVFSILIICLLYIIGEPIFITGAVIATLLIFYSFFICYKSYSLKEQNIEL